MTVLSFELPGHLPSVDSFNSVNIYCTSASPGPGPVLDSGVKGDSTLGWTERHSHPALLGRQAYAKGSRIGVGEP